MTNHTEQKDSHLVYDAYMHISLVTDFETINRKLEFMSQLSSEDFLPLNHKLRLYQKNLEELSGDTGLHQRINASGIYTSVSELIGDMQFYDVLQQRLDHVRKINLSILEELKATGYDPLLLEKTKYIKIITLLSRINFVQLQVINYEYRAVIENLKKCLNGINEFLNVEFNSLDVYHFSNISLFDVVSETICNKLKNISEMIYPGNKPNGLVEEEEMENLKKVFTMEREQDILKKVMQLSATNGSTYAINTIIMKELKRSEGDMNEV